MSALSQLRALLLMLRFAREAQAREVLPQKAPRQKSLHWDGDAFCLIPRSRFNRFPFAVDLPNWRSDCRSDSEMAYVLIADAIDGKVLPLYDEEGAVDRS